MAKMELPKVGDKIPIERFHVSKLNMRADEPFGDAEEDKLLIANLRYGKIVGPFKARLEGDNYGVYMGRRRFLAKKQLGSKQFVVGIDCLIDNVSDEEARVASLVENLDVLRKDPNPITRAHRLAEVIDASPGGLRGAAAQLGLAPSTLSEWLKVLELSPKMQKAVAEGQLMFTHALQVAKMELGKEKQDDLADVLQKDGLDAFQGELARIPTGKMKRGIPGGVYEVERVTWDKRNRKEMLYYEAVKKAAEAKNTKIPDYIKDFIIRHIDLVKKEIG